MNKLAYSAIFFLTFIICRVSIGQTINFNSSTLPIVLINTHGIPIPNEPKIVGDMEIIYNGPGQVNSLTDSNRHFKGKIGVEWRGSTSQDLSPKKPLGIETRKEDGETNLNISLLGMPKENDWILLAPYSDKSLIRDVLIHRIASEIMPYSSRTQICELLINEVYQGVYILMEKIKRDKKRLNINELTKTADQGDSLTGGYILKIDKTNGSTPQGGFNSEYLSGPPTSGRRTYYQYEEPEADVITAKQKNYIQSLIKSFESSFFKSNFADPATGFRKYVNENSMIDFLILNELANNVDGYRLSTFLYKDVDSKDTRFRFGPIWDFNLGFGNADYCAGGATDVLALNFASRCPQDFWTVPFYWPQVFQDSAFGQNLYDRWTALRQSTLTDQNVLHLVDSLVMVIGSAADRNFQKWNILSLYVWPNAYVGGSYVNEIKYLKDWVIKRMKYLDGTFKQLTVPKYYPERYFEAKIFPVPARAGQDITFSYYIHDYDHMRFQIFDISGHHLLTRQDGDHFNGPNQLKTTTFNLPAGVYIYKLLMTEQVIKTGRIIVL